MLKTKIWFDGKTKYSWQNLDLQKWMKKLDLVELINTQIEAQKHYMQNAETNWWDSVWTEDLDLSNIHNS